MKESIKLKNRYQRRFYKQVRIESVPPSYHIYLDDLPLMTPMGKEINLPSNALAKLIAQEWQGVKDKINPNDMPMTQLVVTALDLVADKHSEIITELLFFAEGDLLRYPTPSNHKLFERQQAQWTPILEWANQTHGFFIEATHDLIQIPLDQATALKLKAWLQELGLFELFAFYQITQICNSLMLGLGIWHAYISPKAAIDLAFLEESFQQEFWGENPEIITQQHAKIKEIEQALCLKQ